MVSQIKLSRLGLCPFTTEMKPDMALQVVMEGVAEHLELESLAMRWLVRLHLSALSNLAEYKD